MKTLACILILAAPPFVALYVAHPFVAGLASLWLLSMVVSLLPAPKPTSSQFYRTFFSLAQLVVAELRGFIKLRFPAAPLPPDTAPGNVLQMPSTTPQKPSDAA